MKNQYFGDVGDYGKYSLLRFLSDNGIKLAINWYLTEDDGSNDGKHTSYLQKNPMRKYDRELFDLLSEMIVKGQRDVLLFEMQNFIKNTVYYHELLDIKDVSRDENRRLREEWHRNALSACEGAELVYLDPDNGACEEEPKNKRDSLKYCYADEIADYYQRGQNVIYYCSKGRRSYDMWEEAKAMMLRKLPDAKTIVINFHKGTQRSYIFVLHKEDFRKYSELIKKFLNRWPNIFTEEHGKTGNLSGGKTGEKITLTSSKDVTITIEECEDGWVNMQFSDQKNMYHRISIDHLISLLR